jgi:hypothetical protein
MNASKIRKISAIVLAAPFIVSIATCESQPPLREVAATCDGAPNWCLVATSEMDGHRAAYVYIDGEEKGLILPSKTLRVPAKAGETHAVMFCAVFDVAESKKWECSKPTDIRFGNGNVPLIVSPTVAVFNTPFPRP